MIFLTKYVTPEPFLTSSLLRADSFIKLILGHVLFVLSLCFVYSLVTLEHDVMTLQLPSTTYVDHL